MKHLGLPRHPGMLRNTPHVIPEFYIGPSQKDRKISGIHRNILLSMDSRLRGNDVRRSGNDVRRSGNDVRRSGNDVRRSGNDVHVSLRHPGILRSKISGIQSNNHSSVAGIPTETLGLNCIQPQTLHLHHRNWMHLQIIYYEIESQHCDPSFCVCQGKPHLVSVYAFCLWF